MHEWTDTQRLEYVMVVLNHLHTPPMGLTREVIDDLMNADGSALLPPVSPE